VFSTAKRLILVGFTEEFLFFMLEKPAHHHRNPTRTEYRNPRDLFIVIIEGVDGSWGAEIFIDFVS